MLSLLAACTSFELPASETLLSDISRADALEVCEAVAKAVSAQALVCGTRVYVDAARTQSESYNTCIDILARASAPQCDLATLGHLEALQEPLTCAAVSERSDEDEGIWAWICVDGVPQPSSCPRSLPSTPIDGDTGVTTDRITWFAPRLPVGMAAGSGWRPRDDQIEVVVTVDGEQAAGIVSHANDTAGFEPEIRWTPNEPFLANATVEARLAYCDALIEDSVTFETNSTGLPVDHPAALEGSVYQFDLGGVTVDAPSPFPDFMMALREGSEPLAPLVRVDSVGTDSLVLFHAVADGGSQDPCHPTDEGTASFANPDVETGVQIPLTTGPLEGFNFSGRFRPDGTELVGSLAGLVDTSPAGLAFDGTPEGLCNLLSTVNIHCEPCAGGGSNCLQIQLSEVSAVPWSGPALVERTSAVIANDPNCTSSF